MKFVIILSLASLFIGCSHQKNVQTRDPSSQRGLEILVNQHENTILIEEDGVMVMNAKLVDKSRGECSKSISPAGKFKVIEKHRKFRPSAYPGKILSHVVFYNSNHIIMQKIDAKRLSSGLIEMQCQAILLGKEDSERLFEILEHYDAQFPNQQVRVTVE